MVVLHFAGYPAPVEELATAAGLPLARVIEDAAHALGARVGERAVGSISAATCFSFYATKNLPIGEGGMVTTDDDDVADFVRRTRLHGMSRDAWKRYLPGSGWRYAVDDIGICKLDRPRRDFLDQVAFDDQFVAAAQFPGPGIKHFEILEMVDIHRQVPDRLRLD